MSDFLDALGDVYSELGFPTPTVSPEPNKNLMANAVITLPGVFAFPAKSYAMSFSSGKAKAALTTFEVLSYSMLSTSGLGAPQGADNISVRDVTDTISTVSGAVVGALGRKIVGEQRPQPNHG